MEQGEFPDRLMGSVSKDRGFVTELVYGSVKWKRQLEWAVKKCARNLPPLPLRSFLMVGLYQILDMEDVEEYAAVNETVDAVKANFPQGQADFVNAVLRRAIREKAGLLEEIRKESVGIRTSHPELLVSRWTEAFGSEKALALCEWNNRPAQVVVRINLSRIQIDDFLDRLASTGIQGEAHAFCPDRFVTLPRGVAPARLPGYEDGWFSVQDPSTFMAVQMLAPQSHERVLDACAAPGGKTMAMAELMGGGETLTAMDVHAERLKILKENIDRMDVIGIEILKGDMSEAGGVAELAGRTFDAVLLDVPCTNTGVLRRRADARWRFSEAGMGRVCTTQRSILDSASKYLCSGGRLVYSTCSLEPEEGESLVSGWQAAHPSFELVKDRKLFPPVDGVDGAYAALLVRR